jgi:uncharacterized protein (DUF4415 family)
MKKTEKDYEYLETSEEAASRGLKRISRPKFLDNIPKNAAMRDSKSRITIYLDTDIVEHFKAAASETNEGYQTLINRTLRYFLDNQIKPETVLTEDKLFDENFLSKLKEKLTAV